ncbi:MAG TPA: serine/threonine-protein kinase [Gemmataceae bacterium]|jgi:tetratricopeptide (TPR) repeat protein|nr:serine/threonine-protein kinase [Gemmataceae bacterium]
MPIAANDPTVDQYPPDAAATRTAVGSANGTPCEAPAGFAPPGYEILGEVGRGAMGVVYKARQVALNRMVALKVILGATHAGEDQLTRFRAEATTAAQLQHPNIVQVFEVGEHGGSPFFSLELVEGGTLADRLKGEPQPPREAAELVRTLALAVEHAHSRGVVHRDLKPGNILLSPQSGVLSRQSDGNRLGTEDSGLTTLKVADFGLAKQSSDDSNLTQTGAILGTPSYMAPEQASGDGKAVGPAADIYALGTILYECLTGRPPFRAAAIMDTVLQVRHDDPVPPSRLQPKLPRDLETVCLKCLAKKPEHRYPSATALADDLGRFLNGESVLARPTSGVAKLLKWSRRHPALAGVVFLLAVPMPLLLGVMIFLWADARSARKAVEAEKAAAVEARDKADRERELAQGYLKNALGSMEKIMDRVGDGPLSRMPGAQEERAAILAQAVAFYESLLRVDSTDPQVRFETAQTYYTMSRLNNLAGQIAQAEAAGRTATRLLTDLMHEHPDVPAYRHELARTRLFFGHARILNGDYEDGAAAYREGAELAEVLAREFPNEPLYRLTAADCRRSLGYFYSATQPALAERCFRDALGLAESAHADSPGPESRAILASVLGAYGSYLLNNRRIPESEKLLDRGAALIDPKAGPPPLSGTARLNFDQAQLTIRYSYATIYSRTGRADQAERLIEEVARDYESLIVGQPRAFPYRMQTVQAYSLLSELRGAKKRFREAAVASGRAVELMSALFRDFPAFSELPKGLWFHQIRQNLMVGHARDLLESGSRLEAIQMMGDLNPDLPSWTAVPAYNIGCFFARLATGAEGSARDELCGKAMTWLKKAEAVGYPATATDVEHIRVKDTDLAVLRGRPEFDEWAKSLKPAKK